MQATQSSTAVFEQVQGYGGTGQFAALRHITRQMNFKRDVTRGAGRPVPAGDGAVAVLTAASVAVSTGVAEGAGLAHDAGNLLGALSLYSDLLALPGVLHEEHREYASELKMLSDRSWAMIDRLVNHARVKQPAGVAKTTVLPTVVERCKGLLSKVAGQKIEVTYGVGAYRPVGISAEAVERILTNLVKNAAEATPWVGTISVSVEGRTEWSEVAGDGLQQRVVLTVRDRGCGMDSATVKRLMQGGGAASAGMSTTGGQGLGFRVVRELVAISGGCLNIESQVEVGTSISVEWYAVRGAEIGGGERHVRVEGAEMADGDAGVLAGAGLGSTTEELDVTVVKGAAGWIGC